jgi:hypothetical protein
MDYNSSRSSQMTLLFNDKTSFHIDIGNRDDLSGKKEESGLRYTNLCGVVLSFDEKNKNMSADGRFPLTQKVASSCPHLQYL